MEDIGRVLMFDNINLGDVIVPVFALLAKVTPLFVEVIIVGTREFLIFLGELASNLKGAVAAWEDDSVGFFFVLRDVVGIVEGDGGATSESLMGELSGLFVYAFGG